MIPSSDAPGTGRNRKLWERVLTGVISIVALVTVVAVGTANWDEYRSLVESLAPLPLIGAFAAGMVGQFLNATIAHTSLRVEGTPLTLSSTYHLIAVGGLAKYIPGGIWQIGSQAGLGRTLGLGFRQSILAWIEPTAFNITVGAALASLAATQVDYGINDLLLVSAAVLALAASTNRFRFWLYRLVRLIPRDQAVPPFSVGWPRQLLTTIVIIALTGIGGMLVVSAFDLDTTIGYVGSLAAFVGAWVIGFLAFPIPGGIGVREGALVIALSPWMLPHQAVLVSVASRLIATTAELCSGLIGVAIGWGSPTIRSAYQGDTEGS